MIVYLDTKLYPHFLNQVRSSFVLFKEILHGGNIQVIFWTCACLIKCLHAFHWRELDILSENVVKVKAYYMF